MRFDLRRETASLHDSIDAAFGTLDLTDRDDYRCFVQAHRLAARAAEERLAQASDVPATDLTALLEQDAAALNLPDDSWSPPALDGDQHSLGIAYVLLGSRLGNRLIQRSDYWGKQNAPGDRSDHYLSDRTHEDSWRALVAQLDESAADEAERRAIADSAAATFAAFEQALAHVRTGVPA